jgi:hypothetical protein
MPQLALAIMSYCEDCLPASAESKMAVAQSEASARVGVGLSIILNKL